MSEEKITEDMVKQAFLSKHGRMTKKELVTKFKTSFFSPNAIERDDAKRRFKRIVNKLARKEMVEGVTYLVLKDCYRQDTGLLANADGLQVSILKALDDMVERNQDPECSDDDMFSDEDQNLTAPPEPLTDHVVPVSTNTQEPQHSQDEQIKEDSLESTEKECDKTETVALKVNITATKNSDSVESTLPTTNVKSKAKAFANIGQRSLERRKTKLEELDSSSISSVSMSSAEHQWLILSATADYHKIAKFLQGNADLVSYKNFTNGYNALHWAAKRGKFELVKLLAGVHKVDVDAKTGYTALHLAAMHNHKDIVELLRTVYGAVDLRDNSGKFPNAYMNNKHCTKRITPSLLKSQMRHSKDGSGQGLTKFFPKTGNYYVEDALCANRAIR